MKVLSILMAAVLLLVCGTLYAAFTHPVSGWRWGSIRLLERNGDLANWANEVEDYLDGTSAPPGQKRNIEIFTDDDTLLASETGKLCICDGNDPVAANVILTLPAAETGLKFTFVDANATANDDLYIKASSGDTINGGTAGQYLACKTDSAGQSVTLEAADDTRWLITAVSGTWVADDTPD